MIAAVDEGSGWSQMTQAEWLAARPFTLDCADLTAAAVSQVRQEFVASLAAAICKLRLALDRFPTEAEADKLRAALTMHFNNVRIAAIVRERGES